MAPWAFRSFMVEKLLTPLYLTLLAFTSSAIAQIVSGLGMVWLGQ